MIALSLWPVLLLSGQTAQTVTLRAAFSGGAGYSGYADVALHVVKDALSGAVLSGSVDYYVAYQFQQDTTVTGLALGYNSLSTYVLATDISAASPILATAGSGRISRQVQVLASDAAGLAALNDLTGGSGTPYYIVLVTSDQPAGVFGEYLQSCQTAVLMAVLSSGSASGVATVSVTYTGSPYNIASAEIAIQVAYQFPSQVTFSGMRIYTGQGESGPVAVPADLMPGTPSAASGAGMLIVPSTQVDPNNNPQMIQAIQNLLANPTNFSVDVDTVENPSAPLTGQLHATDFMTLQIPNLAGAASDVMLHTLRKSSGSVIAGTVVFDINYRLAPGAQIAGLDIDGDIVAPGVATDPSGSGNAYAVVTVIGAAALASLNDIVANPAAHQIDVNAASTMSAPLAAASSALPSMAAVIPIVEVTTLSTFAPGELVEIYGTNLAPVTTDLSGWPGGSLPSPLNGVSVNLGGHGARLLFVSPGQVDALLPFGAPLGTPMLTLTNASGTSAPVSLNVAAVAPALYNFAFKNADFSIVSQSNPAHTGDVLVFFTTGMGQTTPTLITGQIVPFGPPYYDTAPVTATIGGANANVIYSIAAPPYVAGLYQMAVTVPSGLSPGNQPVVATSGGIQSNTVTIAVQ